MSGYRRLESKDDEEDLKRYDEKELNDAVHTLIKINNELKKGYE